MAFKPISDNYTSSSRRNSGSANSAYIHKGARESYFGAAGKGFRGSAGRRQEEVRRIKDGEMMLRIAVSAVSGSLDAQIDPRFGRCQCFIIVDSEKLDFEAVPNVSKSAPSGAGIRAAQIIADKGVKIVLTGRVGPNASQALSSAGIEVVTGVSGTVKDAVEKFKMGQLQQTATQANSVGYGMGRGLGRGMGRGRGTGKGGFRRQAAGPNIPPTSSPVTLTKMSEEQDKQMLEEQIKIMQNQLDQINKRLKELEKTG